MLMDTKYRYKQKGQNSV